MGRFSGCGCGDLVTRFCSLGMAQDNQTGRVRIQQPSRGKIGGKRRRQLSLQHSWFADAEQVAHQQTQVPRGDVN